MRLAGLHGYAPMRCILHSGSAVHHNDNVNVGREAELYAI